MCKGSPPLTLKLYIKFFKMLVKLLLRSALFSDFVFALTALELMMFS